MVRTDYLPGDGLRLCSDCVKEACHLLWSQKDEQTRRNSASRGELQLVDRYIAIAIAPVDEC